MKTNNSFYQPGTPHAASAGQRCGMTPEIQQQHQARRNRQRDEGFAEPHRFKVCDQCLSIYGVGTGVCSKRGSYRWRIERDEVWAIARALAKSPFPITLGTVARI